MRKRRRSVVAFIAILLCICTSVHATVLYIQDFSASIGAATTFYTYASDSGNLSLSNISVGSVTLGLEGTTQQPRNGGYTITSAKVSISSSLVQDTSSGGLASGNFQGGGTLTLTGTLKYNGGAITASNSLLLSANMVLDSSQTWVLQEIDNPSTLDGEIDFLPDVSQGLGFGITNTNNGDILKIDGFRADFSFNGVSPNPDVLNTDQTLKGTASTIQFVAAPEPATVFLFTIAALALRINKKK